MRVVAFVFLYLIAGCQPQASTLPDFTELVEKNAPAVVNISTEQEAAANGAAPQIPEMFRHFFEGFEDRFQAPQPPGESLGSGFIISADGDILTNHHVVANASRILVRMQDGSELEAQLVGSDPRSDLALLKVDGKGLPTVRIGRSAELKVGEWVLAIGAPFGFDSTVTAGIVSAKRRSLPSENYVPFIQTDVAINPGNSGGPLFNLDGEVVGINSQIVSRSGGFMGLSFAIPMDMAMDVVEQLRDKGRVSRGWLGVLIQEVDRELAESFGLDKPAGALVSQVLPDSPAAKAGLQVGDVVVRFDDQVIGRSSQLPQVVGVLPPGSKAKADIIRDGKKKTLTITVGELPDDAESQFGAGGTAAPASAVLGMQVEKVSAEELAAAKVSQGVRVTSATGVAASAGIRPGDLLVTLNNQPIASPADLKQVAETLPDKGVVPVLVQRDETPRFLALRLGE